MPDAALIPWPAVTLAAVATVFVVMFSLGLASEAGELRWALGRPGLVARALVTVLVIVPAAAVVVTRALGLPWAAQVGIVLMAVCPGAPVALRRSLDAGGHHSFSTALQLLVATLAVVTMPVSIALLNPLYSGHASISPGQVARQVFTAQLLPIGLGLLARRMAPALAARSVPVVTRAASLMLAAFSVVLILVIWRAVLGAWPRTILAIMVVTLVALAVGHAMGAPGGDTRTAVAMASAIRNPGLALLVAAANNAAPEITATVMACALWSAITVTPYAVWRAKAARFAAHG
jgi:predicted Na+-dependent transporter